MNPKVLSITVAVGACVVLASIAAVSLQGREEYAAANNGAEQPLNENCAVMLNSSYYPWADDSDELQHALSFAEKLCADVGEDTSWDDEANSWVQCPEHTAGRVTYRDIIDGLFSSFAGMEAGTMAVACVYSNFYLQACLAEPPSPMDCGGLQGAYDYSVAPEEQGFTTIPPTEGESEPEPETPKMDGSVPACFSECASACDASEANDLTANCECLQACDTSGCDAETGAAIAETLASNCGSRRQLSLASLLESKNGKAEVGRKLWGHGHNPHGHNPHGHNPHGHNPHGHNPHGHNPHGHSPHSHTPKFALGNPRVTEKTASKGFKNILKKVYDWVDGEWGGYDVHFDRAQYYMPFLRESYERRHENGYVERAWTPSLNEATHRNYLRSDGNHGDPTGSLSKSTDNQLKNKRKNALEQLRQWINHYKNDRYYWGCTRADNSEAMDNRVIQRGWVPADLVCEQLKKADTKWVCYDGGERMNFNKCATKGEKLLKCHEEKHWFEYNAVNIYLGNNAQASPFYEPCSTFTGVDFDYMIENEWHMDASNGYEGWSCPVVGGMDVRYSSHYDMKYWRNWWYVNKGDIHSISANLQIGGRGCWNYNNAWSWDWHDRSDWDCFDYCSRFPYPGGHTGGCATNLRCNMYGNAGTIRKNKHLSRAVALLSFGNVFYHGGGCLGAINFADSLPIDMIFAYFVNMVHEGLVLRHALGKQLNTPGGAYEYNYGQIAAHIDELDQLLGTKSWTQWEAGLNSLQHRVPGYMASIVVFVTRLASSCTSLQFIKDMIALCEPVITAAVDAINWAMPSDARDWLNNVKEWVVKMANDDVKLIFRLFSAIQSAFGDMRYIPVQANPRVNDLPQHNGKCAAAFMIAIQFHDALKYQEAVLPDGLIDMGGKNEYPHHRNAMCGDDDNNRNQQQHSQWHWKARDVIHNFHETALWINKEMYVRDSCEGMC